jgi:hypothetical protein
MEPSLDPGGYSRGDGDREMDVAETNPVVKLDTLDTLLLLTIREPLF